MSLQASIGQINDFYDAHPECIGQLEVQTLDGYKPIQWADITAYDSEILRLEVGPRVLEGSPDHLVKTSAGWVALKNLSIGQDIITVDGPQPVTGLSLLPFKEDLYDIQVEGHEYILDGLVTHNSTIIDAISFALFNQPHRDILKPQLVNSVNERGLEVEIEFAIGPDEYLVRRGLKPRLFEIHKNGALINQEADSRDYQAHLEQVILGLSYKSFHQIVVLGSSSFVPFMQLKEKYRRQVIEDLLDINVFTRMNLLLKTKVSALRERHRDAEGRCDLLRSKIQVHQRYIEDLRNLNRELGARKREQMKEAKKEYKRHKAEAEALELKIQAGRGELQRRLKSLRNREHTLALHLGDLRKQLSEYTAKADFFTCTPECPTCSQAISDGTRARLRQEHLASAQEAEMAIQTYSAEGVELQAQAAALRDVEATINEFEVKAKEHRAEASTRSRELDGLQADLEALTNQTGDVARAEAELKEMQATFAVTETERLDLASELTYAAAQAEMLRDGAIKAKIIERYLPIMNRLINEYLQTLDFFVHFELNETFQEVIKSRHQDIFTYASFSEGEKQRLDLAILFMFRQIARLKNSVVTNLLILDEVVDSSLDQEGIDNFLKILETESGRTNVFIISHNIRLDSRFTEQLTFVKDGNFSRMIVNE